MVNAKNLCAAKKLKEELIFRNVTLSVLSAFIGVAAVTPAPVQASEIDCKVILCLAGGFPAGCSDAHSYMIRRITARPPKPPFGVCEMVDGSAYESYGIAHGPLSADSGAYCPPGKSMRVVQGDREHETERFCYTRRVCRTAREGDLVCTYENQTIARYYDYYIDLTLEPGTSEVYSTGVLKIDFQFPVIP